MNRMQTLLIVGLTFLGALAADRPAEAVTPPAQRREIRQTPLLERPNRPGHFYGNTVRNAHYGRRTS